MTEIRANLDALTALAEGVRTAQSMLGDVDDAQPWAADFTDETRGAHHDFKNKWDERRDQLADGLRSVAEALEMIRDSFEQCDRELAESVSGGGEGE